jgi:CheY-like chemotaxis protein
MARILVIDDEGGVRRLLRGALELKGHEVLDAPSGEKALKLHAATPADLVIMDINMPGTDGLEVIRVLRQETPRPKVIVMSGGGGVLKERVFRISELLGAVETIPKPFRLDVMLEAVERVLAA